MLLWNSFDEEFKALWLYPRIFDWGDRTSGNMASYFSPGIYLATYASGGLMRLGDMDSGRELLERMEENWQSLGFDPGRSKGYAFWEEPLSLLKKMREYEMCAKERRVSF